MEVDGMLSMVNWLGVAVETFVYDPDAIPEVSSNSPY